MVVILGGKCLIPLFMLTEDWVETGMHNVVRVWSTLLVGYSLLFRLPFLQPFDPVLQLKDLLPDLTLVPGRLLQDHIQHSRGVHLWHVSVHVVSICRMACSFHAESVQVGATSVGAGGVLTL